jgi:uncharacterized membrane protein
MKTLCGILSILFSIIALCAIAFPTAIGAWCIFLGFGWTAIWLMKYAH